MRTLSKNQIRLWVVTPLGEQDVVDEDGYFTGEVEIAYSIPKEIRLPLYPASGEVVNKSFGKDVDLDMIATSNEILNRFDLLFYDEPTENYDTTYDYSVSKILKSLNSYTYGLKGRV